MNRKMQLVNMLLKFQPLTFENDVFYIKPEFSKKLHSLFFLQEDIRIVSKGVEKLEQMIFDAKSTGSMDVDLFELLAHGMIITYGRCFTENNGHRRLKSSIFDKNQALKEIHGLIMDLRNEFVAHREDTYRFEAALGWIIPHQNPSADSFQLEFRRTGVKPVELDSYRKLFNFVARDINAAIDVEKEKMILKIKKISSQEWEQYRLDTYLNQLVNTVRQE